ncbi:GIY-YIG nuclease family protein [Rhizobium leguminosarum]|uniref:GIY-YIG nuclease family protein n=1 Tax=Rhizobium leguminosarum TaxID=384 RepID=UPI0032B02390
MIGYTRRPIKNRLTEYSNMHGYQYMVLLANGLRLDDAMHLEKMLQEHVKQDRKHILFKKYCPHRREQRYFPSQGRPLSISPHEPVHSVYMAWWDQYT